MASSDLWLPDQVEEFQRRGAIASFLAVHSPQSFHVARVADDGLCESIEPLSDSDIWFNAGYFVFRREIFDDILPGDELVVEPFHRLIAKRKLLAYRFNGFWQAMEYLQGSGGPRLQAPERRRAMADLESTPSGTAGGGLTDARPRREGPGRVARPVHWRALR